MLPVAASARRIPSCLGSAFLKPSQQRRFASKNIINSLKETSPRPFIKSATARYFSATITANSAETTSTRNGITVHWEEPLDKIDPSLVSQAARDQKSILDTNLGGNGKFHTPETGASLLNGLDIYAVPALGDHHPLAVYGLETLKYGDHDSSIPTEAEQGRQPILLLHGRTWSSVPVYHLLGGDTSNHTLINATSDTNGDTDESRSTMEALVDQGLVPYTMDWRGFGGTPADETGYVEPHQCVQDVETVLQWIAQRHPHADMPPALLGWSQGALVAQLVAQQSHPTPLLSKLILYGSIYDPLVRYPREPLYRINEPNASQIQNSFNDAIEDFTVQGTIPPEPARLFAEAALVSDPIKAVWKHLYQFNNCDPARIQDVPTLVVAGDQDPYAPLHVQQELFVNLGRGSDRTWSILADADHAAHLLNGARHRFVQLTTSFIVGHDEIEK